MVLFYATAGCLKSSLKSVVHHSPFLDTLYNVLDVQGVCTYLFIDFLFSIVYGIIGFSFLKLSATGRHRMF